MQEGSTELLQTEGWHLRPLRLKIWKIGEHTASKRKTSTILGLQQLCVHHREIHVDFIQRDGFLAMKGKENRRAQMERWLLTPPSAHALPVGRAVTCHQSWTLTGRK
jgi:hypothetical protein